MSYPYHFPNRKLAETALGSKPADIVIQNGQLIDVYTGRILPRHSVAISDQWIAYIGPDAAHTVGENTRVIDARGRIISPGYIDSHTHIASGWDIAEFLKYAIPGGTTTIITEAEQYGFMLGAESFRGFLDQIRNRPIKIFALIPPMVTPSPASQALFISREEARALLKDESVMGLGESYWQDVILPPDDRVLGLIQETLIAGKSVQGHTAGAADKRLAAYAAAGAESCHEAVSEENVLSRLELGYYVMIREGHIRRDIEIILPLKDKIDLRRTILVTDGTDPETLAQRGYLTDVVQKAVDLGLDPVKAVQMSSLNPAEHFGLDHMTGGIAPARFADILILPDLKTMQPDMVISKGQVVAENGKCLVPLTKVPYPDSLMHTVKIKPIARADLAVPVSAGGSRKNVRTIDIHPGGLVTREGSAEPKIIGGTYCADPDNDVLKIVFIESVSGRGEKFVGFVRGWGQKRGAVATSFCWDSSGIIALGANDHDLAAAISRVIALQGGLVLADGGKLLVDHALSIGGYISDMTIEDMAASHRQFQSIVRDLGSELESAFLTLQTLTTAAIPFIRMSEKGYCRFRERDIVGL